MDQSIYKFEAGVPSFQGWNNQVLQSEHISNINDLEVQVVLSRITKYPGLIMAVVPTVFLYLLIAPLFTLVKYPSLGGKLYSQPSYKRSGGCDSPENTQVGWALS